MHNKHVYCRRCGYNLTGVNSGNCPECGQSFDLNRPETYHRARFRALPLDVRVVLGLQAFVLAMLLLSWLITQFIDGYHANWYSFRGQLFSCILLPIQTSAMFIGLASAMIYYRKTVPGYRLRLVLLSLLPWVLPAIGVLLVVVLERWL